jgi:CIC family chloride channel protein
MADGVHNQAGGGPPAPARRFPAGLASAARGWLVRARLHEPAWDGLVAVLVGVLCGFAVVGFRLLIHAFHHVFWGEADITVALLDGTPFWRRLIMPALGGLAAGPVIYYLAREAKGHGVPEVMLAVAAGKGVIRGRVAAVKALASALTISSGGSAGREGPVIQMGAALGSWVGQMLRVSSQRLRTFAGCGAAAGIAATFNAPIAGALFAVEVVLGDFAVARFGPIVISSVLATVIARHYFGDGPVFVVEEYHLAGLVELGPYLALGLCCGLVAAVFTRLLYGAETGFQKLRRVHPAFRPMLGGLAVGLLGGVAPHIFGDGYDTINMALQNRLPWLLLGGLIVAKLLGTALTLGSGGSGGVFAPSLFLGAMVGGTLGRLTEWLFPAAGGEAGGYALVGMGGLVAATTHAPLTAILIVFEITSDYSIILPLMVVCVVGTVVSRALCRESIYTFDLVRRGLDLFRRPPSDLLKSTPVSRCLRTDMDTVRPHTRATDLIQRLAGSDKAHLYLVDDQERFAGAISLDDLRPLLHRPGGLEHILLAEDLAQPAAPVCYPDENLSMAVVKFERSGRTELPVLRSRTDPRLAGVLRYTDVFSVYNQELMQADSAAAVARQVSAFDRRHKVRLVEGYSLAEWDPPAHFYGRSLIEVDLPARCGVRAILVKKKSAAGAPDQVVPLVAHRDYVITVDDTLLIYGRDEDLDRVMRR